MRLKVNTYAWRSSQGPGKCCRFVRCEKNDKGGHVPDTSTFFHRCFDSTRLSSSETGFKFRLTWCVGVPLLAFFVIVSSTLHLFFEVFL